MSKTKFDLTKLRKNGLSVEEMIKKLAGKNGEIIKENIKTYEPNKEVLAKLAEKAKGFTIVVFSADWCKDCKKNVAEFAKVLQLNPSIDAIFFKGIKSAPLNPDIRWKIPPSPPEVDDFDLRKIPTFYVLDSDGNLIGKIVENPTIKDTIEDELIHIIENA